MDDLQYSLNYCVAALFVFLQGAQHNFLNPFHHSSTNQQPFLSYFHVFMTKVSQSYIPKCRIQLHTMFYFSILLPLSFLHIFLLLIRQLRSCFFILIGTSCLRISEAALFKLVTGSHDTESLIHLFLKAESCSEAFIITVGSSILLFLTI